MSGVKLCTMLAWKDSELQTDNWDVFHPTILAS